MGGVFKQFVPKSLPLQGWVTGKKSFAESLKTDGNLIEQRINRGVLKAFSGGGGSRSPYKPYDFSAMQRMSGNETSNKMMNDLLAQNQLKNQSVAAQKSSDLQAANSQQQQNINSAMQNSRQNLNNFLLKTPVPSTISAITPATQTNKTPKFNTPNMAGITFGS